MPRVGDDPVAEPRGRRSIIISGRRDRPSSSVRPEPDSAKTSGAGPERVALLMIDVAGSALAPMDKEEGCASRACLMTP